ncbi:hypothetical protein FRX31_017663 [Thalictrum thalictroides]|uniref:Uncharacterized protein n=1 Tax=Thalictrum thalictroides TaxID=46969 RepID=A0A7J6W8P8_THATH|nr:hypothetical protein FRX31_017663 [Thalictrum thalictroides]
MLSERAKLMKLSLKVSLNSGHPGAASIGRCDRVTELDGFLKFMLKQEQRELDIIRDNNGALGSINQGASVRLLGRLLGTASGKGEISFWFKVGDLNDMVLGTVQGSHPV